MGARDKLNAVAICGCVIASVVLGALFESWWAFWGCLAVTLAGSCSAGGIRTLPDARPPRLHGGGGAGHRPARGRRS